VRRRGGSNGLDAWPGYVDALSTLLMVTIFVLLVFVLAEAFLSSALTGSDNTINKLKTEIASLSASLSMETSKDATLASELAALNSSLAAANQANAALTAKTQAQAAQIAAQSAQATSLDAQLSDAQAQLQAANGRLGAMQAQMSTQAADAVNAPALRSQLEAQKKVADDEEALLNQQLAALRAQLAVLTQALNAAQAADIKDKVQITDLGARLNEALARKVEELQQYQSAFFHAMKDALAGQKNLKVVGDRFVFESDVLFPVDSATLTPAGQAEIGQVASAVQAIAKKIPPNVNWILSVDGYADAQPITGGKYRTNFDLSAARALTVLDLLIKDGVPENRIAASDMGANNPLVQGNTVADYAQNRRIEFRLTTP
jgi:chemotaxis protein MotB